MMQIRYYKNPILLGDYKKETKNQFSHSETCAIEQKVKKSINTSLKRTKDKLIELSRSNEWEWFLTFTFDKNNVDRFNYIACLKKLTKWLNNFKTRYAPELQYVIVPERHKNKAWHFHGLARGIPDSFFEIAVNNNILSPYYLKPLRIHYPNGDYIYNIKNLSFGFTTATRIKDTYRASNYILKYITKSPFSIVKFRKRYLCSQGLARPSISYDIIAPHEWEHILAQKMYEQKKVTYHTEWEVTSDNYKNHIHLIELI